MRPSLSFTAPGVRRRPLAGLALALTMSLVLCLMLASVAVAKGPVVHRVSMGGPDLCRSFLGVHPGCDGNFSAVAIEYADGSVSGQWTDSFGRFGGFRADLDCLVVDGQDAWVSGVITRGFFRDPETNERFDLTGRPLAARVYDGTPSGDPDKSSISILDPDAVPCTDRPDYELSDLTEGQVIVR